MTQNNNKVTGGLLLDGRYKLLHPLSSDGGTADVWLALDTNTIDEMFDYDRDELTSIEESGIKVAIKIYRPKNALDFGEQRFREEFKIVFNCHHTNLVQPINFSISEGIPYLVLPFCQHGSSEKLQGKFHDKHELWKYISDVSSGLAYLHAYNPTIVHHDIKPANILIDDNHNYAITDFGISSHRGLNREGYDESQSGTMAYMAPERFKEDYESTPESDIWSFGATLYELITGEVPFGETGGLEQFEKGSQPKPITQKIPNSIKKLIADCLSLEPRRRPSASKIYKAAQAQSYPLKSFKTKTVIFGAFLSISIILFLIFNPKHEKPQSIEIVPTPTAEQVYQETLPLVNSSVMEDLTRGLAIMDSLGSLGYIPAIYEQAYTYGWYGDSASIARKDILGIDIYNKDPGKFLPTSHHINQKAIGLLSSIEEYRNPKYPSINANALYRLACYYNIPNPIFKADSERAERLLEQALQWAEQTKDNDLVVKIKRGLQIIQDN